MSVGHCPMPVALFHRQGPQPPLRGARPLGPVDHTALKLGQVLLASMQSLAWYLPEQLFLLSLGDDVGIQ